MKRKNLFLISIILFIFIILSSSFSISTEKTEEKGPIRIMWAPEKLERTLIMGRDDEVSVSFICSSDIRNVNVWITPNLQAYVSVTPDNFSLVDANNEYSLSISISIPESVPMGLVDGTIHLRNSKDNRTYSKPLKISLYIAPHIENFTEYNNSMDEIFNHVLELKNSLTELYSLVESESMAYSQLSELLSQGIESSLKIYLHLAALYDFESSQIENKSLIISSFSSTNSISEILRGIGEAMTGFKDMLDFQSKENSGKEAFYKDPTKTPDISEWIIYECDGCGVEDWDELISSSKEERQLFWFLYFKEHGAKEIPSVVAKQVVKEYATRPVDLLSRPLSGVKGFIIRTAIKIGIGKFIDWVIDESGNEYNIIGETIDEEVIELPVGTHNIIFSHGNDTERSAVFDIPVEENDTTPVDFKPGFVGEYTEPGRESNWRMFMHDERHTGRSSAIGPQNPNIKWIFDPQVGSIHSSPVIGPDGIIYFGKKVGYSTGVLTAINPEDGSIIWESPNLIGIPTMPAIGEDRSIYVGTTEGWVYCLDPNTRSIKWDFHSPTPGYIRYIKYITITPDNTIYFTDENGRLYSLDLDGNLKWQTYIRYNFDCHGIENSNPAVGPDGSIYVTAHGCYFGYQRLFSINHENGNVNWNISLTGSRGGQESSVSVAEDGTLYVVNTRNGVLKAYAPDSSMIWNMQIMQLCGIRIGSPWISVPTPIAIDRDGTIIASEAWWTLSGYSTVKAFHPLGAVKWSYCLGDNDLASGLALDGEGSVFVAVQDRNLRKARLICLDSFGNLKWSYHFSENSEAYYDRSYPVIGADGTVYIFLYEEGGKLYAFGN